MVAFLKNLMYLLVLKLPQVFYVCYGHKRAEPLRLWVSGNGPKISTDISVSLRGFAV